LRIGSWKAAEIDETKFLEAEDHFEYFLLGKDDVGKDGRESCRINRSAGGPDGFAETEVYELGSG
jgi:hypothetical protein